MKRTRLILIFIISNTLLFYGLKIVLRDNQRLVALGINALQTVGLIICITFLLGAAKRTTNQQKRFWLILSAGVMVYLIANLLWFFNLFQDGNSRISDSAYSLWLIAYGFFLSSLIYWISWAKSVTFKKVYFFNIAIFMITIASVNIHYLIEPILERTNYSMLNTLVMMAYPILDTSIMSVALILYYLVHKDNERGVMLLLISGFIFHVSADSYSAYLIIIGRESQGTLADFFWLMSIWLIGLAGYYAKTDRKESMQGLEKTFDNLEIVLPYYSTVLLIFLVIQSYEWRLNTLSFGLLIIILMIIFRQLYIMKENNKLMDEYKHLAYHDPLTHIQNRESFEEQLIDEMKKGKGSSTALLLIDLDRFKVVNDTLGHQAGDYILKKVATYLQQILECETPVFRLGGDEFAIILPDATEQKCIQISEKVLDKFKKPFLLHDHEVIITASVGISIFPQHGRNYDELFQFADAAMYLAKEGGKNRYKFYDDDLSKIMARRMRIESDLRKALEDNQLAVYYQPKVELETLKIVGMEALLRWNHPVLGWISPAEFIPIAEETGHIISIGEWVLTRACIQNKEWQDKGLPAVSISVNVSVRQFQQGTLLGIVQKALNASNLDPRFLEIEVTESIMQDTHESIKILNRLRDMGINISIDDFGKGYSSLHMIQQLPIDTVKLDKTFIQNMENTTQQAMVKTIIDLGTHLKFNVVAEGIETRYQMDKLVESKCHIGQGFLFSAAVKAEMLEDMLINNSSSTPHRSWQF